MSNRGRYVYPCRLPASGDADLFHHDDDRSSQAGGPSIGWLARLPAAVDYWDVPAVPRHPVIDLAQPWQCQSNSVLRGNVFSGSAFSGAFVLVVQPSADPAQTGPTSSYPGARACPEMARQLGPAPAERAVGSRDLQWACQLPLHLQTRRRIRTFKLPGTDVRSGDHANLRLVPGRMHSSDRLNSDRGVLSEWTYSDAVRTGRQRRARAQTHPQRLTRLFPGHRRRGRPPSDWCWSEAREGGRLGGAAPAGAGAAPGTGDGDGGCKKEVLPGEAENSAASTPGPDVALQLSRLSDRYRLVFQLTSDVAETFSVPVLSLYAITTAILLIGGYLLVVPEPDSLISWVGAYCLGITVCVICLCGISISGSSLTQQSNQLRDVIAKDLWPRPMSPATRQQLQLFMDQTTTPLAIDIWGLFSLQKTSVLSVMSFVLTYFVIMLQMIN